MTQKYVDQRDESLFRSIVSYEDITTADGSDDGSTTLICSRLTTKPDFDGGTVVIASGDYKGQSSSINGITTGGTVTPITAFDGQITANTKFKITTVRTAAEVAAIEAKLDHGTTGLAALKAILDTSGVLVNARSTAYHRLVGVLQIKATTIELNQAAGAKDLFTGTTQDVVVEKLLIRIPVDVSGGAMTSLSIQTDDTTAQVFIDSSTGAKANLTAQAQLAWTGAILLKATKKIQLTIAGAATGIACSCDVIAECRAAVSGGYLG